MRAALLAAAGVFILVFFALNCMSRRDAEEAKKSASSVVVPALIAVLSLLAVSVISTLPSLSFN